MRATSGKRQFIFTCPLSIFMLNIEAPIRELTLHWHGSQGHTSHWSTHDTEPCNSLSHRSYWVTQVTEPLSYMNHWSTEVTEPHKPLSHRTRWDTQPTESQKPIYTGHWATQLTDPQRTLSPTSHCIATRIMPHGNLACQSNRIHKKHIDTLKTH